MDSKERTAKLNLFGSAITSELNQLRSPLTSSWSYVTPTEDTYSTYCVNAVGARIYFSFTSYGDEPKRLSISGWLHIGKGKQYVQVYDEQHNKLSTGEITVALERGATNIAKDILRRFLPHYLEVYALAQHKVATDAAYEGNIVANLAALSQLAGWIAPRQEQYREVQRQNSGRVNGRYVTITASARSADQAITIDDLTLLQVAHILAYLKSQPKIKA